MEEDSRRESSKEEKESVYVRRSRSEGRHVKRREKWVGGRPSSQVLARSPGRPAEECLGLGALRRKVVFCGPGGL